MRISVFFFLSLLTAGCIGTDLVDEPLGPVPSQAIIEENSLSLLPGENRQLTFRILASNGQEIDGEWNWSSRDEAIAAVDGAGLLRVTVVADPSVIASVTIEGESAAMAVGEVRQLSAVARNAQGQALDGIAFAWSSSAAAVATVDENGMVVATGDGTANITASADGITSLPFAIVVGSMGQQRSGPFEGPNGYSVSGTPVLEQGEAGARLLLNDDFRAQNGPGLHVYLSPQKDGVSGGVDLGELTATSGAQSYDIPGTVNPDNFDFVIIHCKPFDIPFGAAELE